MFKQLKLFLEVANKTPYWSKQFKDYNFNINSTDLKKELLKPTKIYVVHVLELIKRKYLNACANITGGGLADNISRVIPNVMSYQSSKDSSKSILNSFLPTSIGDNFVTLCWGSVPSTRLSISDSL